MSTQAIFEKKNVLVIGGAGFIGSHLCDELVKTAKVICVDNFISGDERNIDHLLAHPDFEFVKHDITQPLDFPNLKELEKFRVAFQGIQEVYMLASPTLPKDFEQTRMATLLTGSIGLYNALELAVEHKAKFLFTSSSVVYGPRSPLYTNVLENVVGTFDHLNPRSCYDEGKRFGETMVRTYADVHGLDAKIVRVFRTYGPRMRLNQGQMLPDFVSAALEDKDLVIYGDERFSSSLCHVNDVVQGLVKCMTSTEAGPINIGSDIDVPLREVAESVIRLTGSSSKIVFEDPLAFMTPLPLPDISLAKERLGWFPIVRLEDGIQGAIDYFKAHKMVIDPVERLRALRDQ